MENMFERRLSEIVSRATRSALMEASGKAGRPGSRKGTLSGMDVREKGLDRNGNPRYHTDDPSCKLGRKCSKGGRDFSSYERFEPVDEAADHSYDASRENAYMIDELKDILGADRLLDEICGKMDQGRLSEILKEIDSLYSSYDDDEEYHGPATDDGSVSTYTDMD